ncbi:S24 family peptidase [Zavarzinia compransoris]|nr:LexA family transcriptional regulator [Zavarzinia compransoris]
MDTDAVLAVVKARLKELGMSAKDASLKAVGNDALIANMGRRRYGSPTLENLMALARALDLELYFGPPRRADMLEPPPAIDTRVGGQDFNLIARYNVNVSAGPGLVPVSETEDGHLAFSKTWLRDNGINPARAGIVRVQGDSMAPTIPDGALVLVHGAEDQVQHSGIYAFSRAGHSYVKRLTPLGRGADGRMVGLAIVSDNPSTQPEVLIGAALNELRIVGRVRCAMISL